MMVRHLYVAVVLSVVALLAPVGVATAAGPTTLDVFGRLSLPEGSDTATVRIFAERRTAEGWHLAWNAAGDVSADGAWSFSDLAPGEYRFEVSQLGEGPVPVRYRYPTDGTTLTLAAGEQRTGVDFAVPLAARLSGSVDVPDGVVASDLDVVAHPRAVQGSPRGATRSVAVSADGTWTLTQLVPGTYRVSVEHGREATWPAFHGGDDLESASDVVVLPGGEATSIDMAVKRAGTLAGRVDLSALDESSRHCVTATVHAMGSDGYAVVKETPVAADGSYFFGGLRTEFFQVGFADTCRVVDSRVRSATQFFPDALEVGKGFDVLVVEGAESTVPQFALAPAGHLTGNLHAYDKGTRTPVHDVRVALYRKSGMSWKAVAEQWTEQGSYRFDSIPAGDYRVGFATGHPTLREVFHPSALTLAKARTVTVAASPHHEPTHLGEAITWRRDAKVAMTYAPGVRGKARVGRTLRAEKPAYAQDDVVTIRYQWQLRRHGKVRDISGATAKRIALKPRHAGAQVRLRIIATALGHQRHVHRTKWSKPVRRR